MTMEDPEQLKTLGVVDYIVIIGLLLVAMIIGIYYAIKDKNDATMETYNFGGRKMSPIPLGLSISATFISALTFIAFPAETYLFGMVMLWFCFASILPTCIMCAYYIPLMHRLQISSMFEFFELRFNRRMRKLGSVLGCLIMVFYMATTIYIPGIALSAVTPLGLITTILLTSGICTFYTTLAASRLENRKDIRCCQSFLQYMSIFSVFISIFGFVFKKQGGMKAVVWTDTFQTIIMFLGFLVVLIKVTVLVGGFGNAWTIAEQGGRLNFFNFNPDPRIRNTFWTIIGGCAISWSNPNQAIIQRYLSCDSVSKARKAAIVSTLPHFVFILMSVIGGILMYAYYHDCDPLRSHKIDKPDQMMPYLAVDIFQDMPGMAGLFVSAGFSGTLSTVSSGINSLAALIMEDFVVQAFPKLSQAGRVTISKGIVIAFGVLVTAFAISIGYINGTVIQIGYTFAGTIGGGMCGVFALGLFCPWTSTIGAFLGECFGIAFTAWISMGGLLYGKSPTNQAQPLSIDGCPSAMPGSNISSLDLSTTIIETTFTTTTAKSNESNGLESTLYAISYLYYAAIAMFVTVLVGSLVSLITGANKPSEADPNLFVPFISHPIFPSKIRKFFRFGVPELSGEKIYQRKERKENCEKEHMVESISSNKLFNKDGEMTETNI